MLHWPHASIQRSQTPASRRPPAYPYCIITLWLRSVMVPLRLTIRMDRKESMLKATKQAKVSMGIWLRSASQACWSAGVSHRWAGAGAPEPAGGASAAKNPSSAMLPSTVGGWRVGTSACSSAAATAIEKREQRCQAKQAGEQAAGAVAEAAKEAGMDYALSLQAITTGSRGSQPARKPGGGARQ